MIPQNNPLANYVSQKPAIDQAIDRVLASGQYILGPETTGFEDDFARYLGVSYAVAMGSGTEALHLGLRACGVGPGDEVITVSHTAVATVAAIEMTGARPVLVDIETDTYTLDPGEAQKALTGRTKAIVPVHLYGQPSNIKPLLELRNGSGKIRIIEDCAQAHGSLYGDRKAGAWGDAAAFSFYPTKNLGCLGDGGAVVTNSRSLHERLLALRQYGWDRKRVSQTAGFNSRLDEVQAAVLRIKLVQLEDNNRRRRNIARSYDQLLAAKDISLPRTRPESTHVYHQYVIRVKGREVRDRLKAFLFKHRIGTAVHYPIPVHLQPAYVDRLAVPGALPVTEACAQTVLSLPMFPEIPEKDILQVAQTVNAFFNKKT